MVGILDQIQQGSDFVTGLFDTDARRRAGRAYAAGDYDTASGLLAARGDIVTADQISRRGGRTNYLNAVNARDFSGARDTAAQLGDIELNDAAMKAEDQDRLERVQWLTQAKDALKQIPYGADGSQRKQAFDQFIAPTLERMGIGQQDISTVDATQLTDQSLDAFATSLGAQTKRRIEKVGDSLVEVLPDGTAREVFKAPQGSKVVGNSLVTDDGRVLYTAPEYRSVGEGQSLVEIQGGGSQGNSQVPRGLRNNNPGNIEDGEFARSQPGYRGSDGRFAIFDSAQSGQAAQGALLQRYGQRGINTVLGAVSRWAPASDGNNPQQYAAYVARRLGVSPSDQIDLTNPQTAQRVAQAMAEFENGTQSRSNGASQQGSARIVATGQRKQSDVPSGYRFRQDGNLEPIPGGPADPAIIQATKTGGNRKGETDLRKEFNARPEVKEYRDVANSYRTIQRLQGSDSAAGDISLIFAYMKMLDPGSVVREGEFATAQNAAGIPDRVVNAYNKALNGERLNPRQRQDFVTQAKNIFDVRGSRFREIEDEYRGYAEGYGLDPSRVAPQATQAPPVQGARQGNDGGFYIEDPNRRGSFPRLQQAPDGNWYIRSANGKYLRVK